jgi:DNA-binding SARP family transcriptional activator
VLASLAVNGERGVTRDRLLHLLWSDSDPEKARHALTQSLYALRRLLGVEDAILGTAQLSLNPERVATDVADFERALAARDAQSALEAHRGPLLEGFSVSGAPELERWIEEQRVQFIQRLSTLLDSAAKALHADGRHGEAATILRRRAALDPLDATAALALMRAWSLAGDTPAAVQHARVYGELVRQELDLEPDPRVEELARELLEQSRTRPGERAAPANDAASPGLPALAVKSRRRLLELREQVSAVAHGGLAWWRRRSRRWRLLARQAATMSVALIVVLLAVAKFGSTRREAVSAPTATAVLPFRGTGLAADLSFLPSGIVDLLSESMAERDTSDVIDAEAVHRWWSAVFGDRTAVSSDSVLDASAGLGARRLVTGTLVGNARQLVIRASLLDASSRAVAGTAVVNGPLDSLPILVNRVATLLVASAAGAGEQLRVAADADPRALRAYLQGRAAYRRADFRAAQTAFAAALARDSSLGAAAIGLALASDWLEESMLRGAAMDAARARRSTLAAVERQQLVALEGPRYPQPSSAEEHFAAWERAARTGERAELWTDLGRRLLLDGRLAGVPESEERARQAFVHALELDSTYISARLALSLLGVDGPAGSDLEGNPGEMSFWLAWRLAARSRDTRALERVREGFDGASDDALRRIALAALGDGDQLADGEQANRVRGRRAQTTAARIDAILAEHAYALNGGSPSRALAATRRLEDLATNGAHLRLRVLDALYADGDSAAGAEAAQRLTDRASRPAQGSDDERAVALVDLCVLEQWRVWHRDFENVDVSIRALAQAGMGQSGVPVSAGTVSCAWVLDAIASGLRGGPRAGDAMLRAERLALSGPASGDLRQYATLALARVRERRGELARALVLVDRRSVARGWPRYLASYLRLEASLAERLQDNARAAQALRQFVALRVSPDSSGWADVESARAQLRRLEGQS